MEEEEYEVYGGEIFDVGEMDGDMEVFNFDMEMVVVDEDVVKVCCYFFFFLFYCFGK